jgi:uncharacterized protein
MNAEHPRASAIEKLETAECWALLEATSFGRLAVINADGTPDIFPVNYVPHHGSLYVRTARDAKFIHIARHPAVAFEIDGHDDDDRWSVVVRGDAERVTREDEIRESGVMTLASWSPTPKFFVMKIAARAVTGRRFPKTEGRIDHPRPFEGHAAPAPATEGEASSASTRPQPIPHRGPLTTRSKPHTPEESV